MKLALAGLFLMLAAFSCAVYEHTGSPWAAIGGAVLAIGSIYASAGVFQTYKGDKR